MNDYAAIERQLVTDGYKPRDIRGVLTIIKALDLEVPAPEDQLCLILAVNKTFLGADGLRRLGRITRKRYLKRKRRSRARMRRAYCVYKTTVRSSVNPTT